MNGINRIYLKPIDFNCGVQQLPQVIMTKIEAIFFIKRRISHHTLQYKTISTLNIGEIPRFKNEKEKQVFPENVDSRPLTHGIPLPQLSIFELKIPPIQSNAPQALIKPNISILLFHHQTQQQ